MALDSTVKQQLEAYLELLETDIVLSADLGEDESSKKMREFLEEVVSLSDKLSLKTTSLKRVPSFRVDTTDKVGNIEFAGIPLGHELASFTLALLQSSGRSVRIEEALVERIKSIKTKLEFETYVSLSCHICPDVVQALNVMAVLNDNITHTMIDGGIYKAEIEEKDIMAVPTIYLNNENFVAGRISLEEILDEVVGKQQVIVDTNKEYDVVVIGGGPAGASSAIYAARKGLNVAVISDRIGGQVLETYTIENIIGTPHTEGVKFAASLEEHMRKYAIDIYSSLKVENISKDKFVKLKLDNQQLIKSKTAIITTGARWRNVNVKGEMELKNKGVAYCPHCDGPLYEGKNVAVIGGGNSGIEAAIDLANIAKHVYVVEFAESLKADEVLQTTLNKLANVTVIVNGTTTEIVGENKVEALTYQDRSSKEEFKLDVEGVFVQIGLVPNTEWVDTYIDKTTTGEIIVDKNNKTNVAGIFAAGDCTDSTYKQIIISMGDGATAALSAFDYIMHYFKE